MLQFIFFMMMSLYLNPVFASNSNNLYTEEERTQAKVARISDTLTSEDVIQEFDYGDKQVTVYHLKNPVYLVMKDISPEEDGNLYFSTIYKRSSSSKYPNRGIDDEIGNLMFEVRQENERNFPSSIYITWIGINSEFQNKGYGTSILKVFLMALNNDQDWKFDSFVLSVELNNLKARHVYKKLGFQEIIEKATYMRLKRTEFIYSFD